MPRTEENQVRTDQPDVAARMLSFSIEPPFKAENCTPHAPDFLLSAVQWALRDAGVSTAKNKVQLKMPLADLIPSKSDDLRRRIRLVLALEIGRRTRTPLEAYSLDLTPKSLRANQKAAKGESELTQHRVPRDPQAMRGGRTQTHQPSERLEKPEKSTASNDALAVLNELAHPTGMTEEMKKLEAVLVEAKLYGVSDRQRWVEKMNAALEVHAVAIKIEATGEICRRFYIDRNDIIGLQNTDGDKRGFKEIAISLVPYVRPYKRNYARKDSKTA